MVAEPQDPARHAGQVVRRVLLRRNIAVDPETAQLVAAAVQARSKPVHRPGRHAGARADPPPTATRCSDTAPAIRRACSCPITGEPGRADAAAFPQVASAMVGDVAR